MAVDCVKKSFMPCKKDNLAIDIKFILIYYFFIVIFNYEILKNGLTINKKNMKNEIEIINQRDVELLEKTRKINLQKLFTEEGMNEIISAIKAEVKDFKADIATKEGRAEIVSMAFKIAKCKAPIENLASELKEDSRKLIDGVNAQWNRYKKEMDTLRDEIRKPVDEIEVEEKRILEEKQDRLKKIENFKNVIFTSVDASKLYLASIEEIKNILNFDFGDFAFKAENLAKEAIEIINQKIAILIKQQEQEAELKQLKKEKEEREKKDREEQIAREAVEKARIEAEAREKRIEQEKIDAENRAKEAERLRIEQAKIAENNRILAEKKAKEDAEKAVADAIEKERNRVESEKRKEAEALEKREANKKHRAKINNEALEIIILKMSLHFSLETLEENNNNINDASKALIEAIARGEVPHVQINY